MIEIFAKFTRHHFEFIGDVTTFVAEEAKQLIIHITFSKDFNECCVIHLKKHWKLQGFYLIFRPYLRYKIQTSQERLIFASDFDFIDDTIVKAKAILFAGIADVSLFENDEVEVIIEGPNGFLGVWYFGFELLWEVAKGAFQKGFKENEFIENFFVGFFEVGTA